MRIGADEITKCEDCGCLLLKTKEFKRDSTIEKYVEKVVGFSNYGYAITKKVSPPPEDWDGDVKEELIEHYKCHRCAKMSL
jgi:hypothetical protein